MRRLAGSTCPVVWTSPCRLMKLMGRLGRETLRQMLLWSSEGGGRLDDRAKH